jgi:hypothetical protein
MEDYSIAQGAVLVALMIGAEDAGCMMTTYQKSEGRAQADLLRHIVGNPFRLYRAPSSWSTSSLQLADALYDGQDCAFALQDSLLEAGHAELAEHFRDAESHPKGCWVVDLLLGKS